MIAKYFDLTFQVETLQRDQLYAIKKIGIEGKINPGWRHRNYGNNTMLSQIYFSQLTKNHVEKLYRKFQLDFELFNYSPSMYYNFATSSV